MADNFTSLPSDLTQQLARYMLVSALRISAANAQNGTVAAPGVAFEGDQTSGIYRYADGSAVGIVFAGVEVATATPSGLVWVQAPPIPWTPVLMFGGQDTGMQIGSAAQPLYAVFAGYCDWELSLKLIYKGSSTGQFAITAPPPIAAGGRPWKADICEVSGIASATGVLNAAIQDGLIVLYAGQDPGVTPSPYVMDTDVENAALITLSGRYRVEST